MTISSQSARLSYAGNGVTTVFAAPYFVDDDDLVVSVVAADGTATIQTLTTHYTVSGAENPAGGTVTMLTAPAVGTTLVIYNDPPLIQPFDYVDGGRFNAESHERGMDRLVMMMQRVRDMQEGILRLEDSGANAYDVEGRRISNLAPPLSATDAATRQYADDILAGAVLGSVPNASVTNAKLANMAANTVKANLTAGATAPQDVTKAALITWLALASTDVTNFTEAVQDVVGAFVVGGTGITPTYNDGANTLTIGLTSAPMFTKSYTSPEQTITSGAGLSLAHGMALVPTVLVAWLVCKNAEAGFAINDRVPIPTDVSSSGRGMSMSATSTTITVGYQAPANVFALIPKTGGGAVNLTNGNWRLVVNAFG